MLEWLEGFDRGVRPILLGYALAVLLALAMVANIDADLAILVWGVTIAAVLAPSSGLTVLAGLALLREPAGLGPLGFNATVVGATGLGVLARQTLGGWSGRQVTVRPEIAAIGAFVGLSIVQFLRLVARTTAERERFGLSQLVATCAEIGRASCRERV